MKQIFVNLKRFDVPRSLGGICPMDMPGKWIEWVLEECIKSGIGKLDGFEVTFFLPESLIIPAANKLSAFAAEEAASIRLGCQGVYREDIAKGGNFGAFTTNRPAAAMKNLGCNCSIIGHSEERKDKLGIFAKYDPAVLASEEGRKRARHAVDVLMNEEILCALNAGMKVLTCIGETAEERGDGSFEEQKPRIEAILKDQLEAGLKDTGLMQPERSIVVGYEPIWAIGPGKVPPGAEYISFVSGFIKKATAELFGFKAAVVYGGGLKEENAGRIAGIDSIDGGLVALTRFSGDIGFYPDELRKIIDKYQNFQAGR